MKGGGEETQEENGPDCDDSAHKISNGETHGCVAGVYE